MGKISEPEGGNTTFQILSSSGSPWVGAKIEHNHKVHTVDKMGNASLHVNGGEVYANGINITKKVQKGVANIFRHDMGTGDMKKVTPKDGDNTLIPPAV